MFPMAAKKKRRVAPLFTVTLGFRLHRSLVHPLQAPAVHPSLFGDSAVSEAQGSA